MKPYNITQSDFLEAQKINIRLKLFILPVVPLLIGSSILRENLFTKTGAIVMGTALIGVVISAFSIKKKIIKAFRDHKSLHETTTMSFDDEIVRWESESGSFKQRISDIEKFRIGRNITFIFETKRLMRIVPHRAFDNPEELAMLHELLNKNC